ncbi:MAG: MFS transporter [Burkholderiales bacterium]|nr:MFS transporter [Burkholderiales bacterium]
MRQRLVESLAARLPFFYGWVILACVCAAGFSRQGPAVATLSIFIEPMTAEFGWSRTEISGAVSIGGILGALVSPLLGPFLDRNGARAVLCFAVLATAVPLLLLSFTESLLAFYLLYCVARMNFAGPYDLGIYGSIVNWFVRRRTFVTSISTVALMSGLVAMPMIAHLVMQASGWRSAWLAVGATVLVVGFLPTWVLHVRRPEDIGQRPDGERAAPRAAAAAAGTPAPAPEPSFTRRQAVATPAFWLLALFTALVYPVQSGISLHQAPFLIERGLDASVAAGAVSIFALLSGAAGFAFGFWPRRTGLRPALALVALALGASSALMLAVRDAPLAYAAAGLFGIGVGGLITTLPIAWADYFGRRSFGAIRGVALTVQVGAQAAGPVLSGVLRDATGAYEASLVTFAALGFAGLIAALVARPPRAAR